MGFGKGGYGRVVVEGKELDEGVSGRDAGGGGELLTVRVEGEGKDAVGEGSCFLVIAPLVFDAPDGSGGEGENGVVGKAGEEGGVV